ncbi:hypothetical protein N7532_000611 [Penicillium argentinense]|uniref:Uncharacterized protein n=1 Tax=Penicillium argentinense TaxID=1131581 RepID=A0A9W9G5T7_9EURO|nr:uncharacterized protein N7532_000611 [Penicillium argentinense]KAJ5112566.1 hypothetical protein N7532_000611 [Penicillium argentinense]
MPSSAVYPDINIPDVDLWGLMFENEREEKFPVDKTIYRDAITNRQYTYSGLRDAAIAFGQGLRSAWDWKKGDIITLFTPNSIDMPVVIYGTFFAGGIVSPANPSYSVDELAFQLKDNGTKAIATFKSLLPIVTAAARKTGISPGQIILIGDERDFSGQFRHVDEIMRATSPHGQLRARLNPDTDLAFLVYSSGTTGLPKGVILSHRNIVSNVLMVSSSVGKSYSWHKDKLIGILPFYHIYGLTCLIHQPLYRGIEMIAMERFDLETFLGTVQDEKITFVYLAPPVLVHLANNPIVDKYDLSSLRMVTSGAAPLTRELVDTVHKRLNIKINQAYGLSETSPITHTQPWDEWYTSVGSVGKLMPNLSAKYLSPDGGEVPTGQDGELCLKGPSIFKGYLNNEEGTRNAFTSDGYFKTGDVGYHDSRHNFYITDRVKELIKYKGFQVAPAGESTSYLNETYLMAITELEGLLISHPTVADVAVIGVDQDHTEVPRAYIVLSHSVRESPTTAEVIRKWMDSKVSHHKKLRGGVRFVDQIPKSAAGKILRRNLKEIAKQEQASLQAKL